MTLDWWASGEMVQSTYQDWYHMSKGLKMVKKKIHVMKNGVQRTLVKGFDRFDRGAWEGLAPGVGPEMGPSRQGALMMLDLVRILE